MKNLKYIILAAFVSVLCSCSNFDDSSLRERVDGYKERIKTLKAKAEELNRQISDLSYLTNGNVITSVSQDANGKYVVTYKDNLDEQHTVVVATMDDIIDVPIIGVDLEEGVYYWTKHVDGVSSWLTDDEGNKFPVSGYTPAISVDAGGFWTVDGKQLVDGKGKPIEAHDDATSVFRDAKLDGDGNFHLTLGDGSTMTLPVFNSLNLKLDAAPVTAVADPTKGLVINYTLLGESKDKAVVALAKVEGLEAVLDPDKKSISVTFDASFSSGKLFVMAYDLAQNVVLRPLFFTSAGGGAIMISTAAELTAFASAVNAGGVEASSKVILTSDIDLKDVTSWTPIGKATFAWASNRLTITGTAFSGVFDGQGHTIKNLKLSYSGSTAGAAYGLFGVLNKAAVCNLNIDAGSSLTVKSTGSGLVAAGVIAGVCNESLIEECTSYAPMSYDGASTKQVTMSLVGFVFCNSTASKLSNLKNYGAITGKGNGNLEAGGNAVHCAGICGFATNDAASTTCNVVEYCDNYGNMTTDVGRTAGIVGAANRYTSINSCTNHGDQLNTMPKNDGSRLGNITCFVNAGSSLTDCVNNGKLVSTTAGRVGGIASLVGDATSTISGCANYGDVISDGAYRGVFFGYSSVASTWINCIAGGRVGVYAENSPVFDAYPESEQLRYLGSQSGSILIVAENITYQIGASGGGSGGGSGIEPTLRILFIGNSFTKDAVEHLPKMLAAAGIQSVKMVHMYYGGRTVPEYTAGYATVSDYSCYQCNTGSSVWVTYKGYTLKNIADSEKWDIVAIQEHTGRTCAWAWDAAEKSAIAGLISSVKSGQGANNPKFVYIMSQAYFNMNKLGGGQSGRFASQAEMFKTITAQAQKVLAETEIEKIIPTGTVLQNLRSSSLNNALDLTRDGYHMDYGISRYAASCAVFESMISPYFGDKKLDDNSFRYNISNTNPDSYSTPVTDVNAPVALQAARYALTNPFVVTNMAGK